MEDKDLEALLKKDPVALCLPVRVENLLYRMREDLPRFLSDRGLPPIHTIGDLLQWTEVDLLCIKKMGRKSVKDIKDALKVHGLALKEREDRPRPRPPKPEIPIVNIIQPVSQILHILSGFSPSARVRIVRALRAVIGD